MRRSAHVVLAALALASCRDGGAQEPRTTVPTAPTTASTTATTLASYAVPAVIDQAYIESVMAALDHVYGEAARHIARERAADAQFAEYLVATFGGESFSLKQRLWGQVLNNDFRLLRTDPGDAKTTVERILVVDAGCILFQAGRDFFRIFNEPDPAGPPRFVGLVPLPPGRDVRHVNPTPWLITFDGRRSDGVDPSREEACTAP